MRWQRGPLESGNFGENGVFGENVRNGDLSPKSPKCKQKFKFSRQGTYSEHGPYYSETVTVTNVP